jgi:hypothetical protein
MKTLNPSNPASSGGYSQAQVDALLAEVKPKFDLLWENPSPTDNFAAQTVTVDLSKYNLCAIQFSADNSYSRAGAVAIGLIPSKVVMTCGSQKTTINTMMRRTATISTDSIKFDSGYYWNSSESFKSATDCCVPQKIYGIKF